MGGGSQQGTSGASMRQRSIHSTAAARCGTTCMEYRVEGVRPCEGFHHPYSVLYRWKPRSHVLVIAHVIHSKQGAWWYIQGPLLKSHRTSTCVLHELECQT